MAARKPQKGPMMSNENRMTIDGSEVTFQPGETVLEVARRQGLEQRAEHRGDVAGARDVAGVGERQGVQLREERLVELHQVLWLLREPVRLPRPVRIRTLPRFANPLSPAFSQFPLFRLGFFVIEAA